MFQALSLATLLIFLVAGDSVAQRDVYRYTRRPTSYVKGDGYRITRRPTYRYAEEVKGDGYMRYFRRYFTRRPTLYRAAVKSDRQDAKVAKVQNKKVEQVGKVGKVAKGAQQMVPEPKVMDKNYFYVKNKLAWDNAQQACARRGAQLPIIHSMNEHQRVGQACQGQCWLGADRSTEAGSFKWSDSSAMDFEKWTGDRQRHEAKSGLCVKMSDSPNKEWTSADCDEQMGFVCQKMQWQPQMQASVDESNYFAAAANFARGNILSLALMISTVVVVGFLACNYVCVVVVGQKKSELLEKSGVDDIDGGSDETKPLLWTRA